MFILLYLGILFGSLLLGTFVVCACIVAGMVDVEDEQ